MLLRPPLQLQLVSLEMVEVVIVIVTSPVAQFLRTPTMSSVPMAQLQGPLLALA